jgi:hypothetical protein
MAALLDKSALKFTVTQDASNPNIIIMTSETPNVTPYWVTPMGNSTSIVDTIDIPFPGTDTIFYSVEGAGGLTQADPYVLNITTLDPAAVSDTTWVDLTGGYGNSKTWVLDCDANGVSKYFLGPIYFGGTGWEWDPALAGNSWITTPADFGTMTFNLINNANFSSDNKTISSLGSASGKFMLWPSTMELQTYGAELLHDPAQGASVKNWYIKTKIQSISKNTLQIDCVTAPGAWTIYNYISQDYYNSH